MNDLDSVLVPFRGVRDLRAKTALTVAGKRGDVLEVLVKVLQRDVSLEATIKKTDS